MAWEEREVVVIVVHHPGVEDHFTQRIAAMNVVNVDIMLEIATVTGVAVEGAGAGMHVVYPLCLFFLEASQFDGIVLFHFLIQMTFWVLILKINDNSKLIC